MFHVFATTIVVKLPGQSVRLTLPSVEQPEPPNVLGIDRRIQSAVCPPITKRSLPASCRICICLKSLPPHVTFCDKGPSQTDQSAHKIPTLHRVNKVISLSSSSIRLAVGHHQHTFRIGVCCPGLSVDRHLDLLRFPKTAPHRAGFTAKVKRPSNTSKHDFRRRRRCLLNHAQHGRRSGSIAR